VSLSCSNSGINRPFLANLTCLWRFRWGDPVRISVIDLSCRKTKVPLLWSVVCVILHLATLVQYRLVTDRRTDGRTVGRSDGHMATAHFALAWRCAVKTGQFTTKCKVPSTPATTSKQHCRMLQVERLRRQSRMLLRHCGWCGRGLTAGDRVVALKQEISPADVYTA